jgi:hypothetical protein
MKCCYVCHQEVEEAQAKAWSDWLVFVSMTNPELHERIVNNLGLDQRTGPDGYLLPDGHVVVCEACMTPYALGARCAYCGEVLDPEGLCDNGCSRPQRCIPIVPGIILTSFTCLLEATRMLAQSTGDVQQRLALSYAVCLEPPGFFEDLSDDLQATCEQLRARMMYAGSPDLTARLLGDDEANELIEIIVRLTAKAAVTGPRQVRPDRLHALDEFLMAVLALAQGTEPKAERVGKAYSSNLAHLVADEMPGPVCARLESIGSRLNRGPAVGEGDEGTIEARFRAEDEPGELIDDVVYLYGEFASDAGR